MCLDPQEELVEEHPRAAIVAEKKARLADLNEANRRLLTENEVSTGSELPRLLSLRRTSVACRCAQVLSSYLRRVSSVLYEQALNELTSLQNEERAKPGHLREELGPDA